MLLNFCRNTYVVAQRDIQQEYLPRKDLGLQKNIQVGTLPLNLVRFENKQQLQLIQQLHLTVSVYLILHEFLEAMLHIHLAALNTYFLEHIVAKILALNNATPLPKIIPVVPHRKLLLLLHRHPTPANYLTNIIQLLQLLQLLVVLHERAVSEIEDHQNTQAAPGVADAHLLENFLLLLHQAELLFGHIYLIGVS